MRFKTFLSALAGSAALLGLLAAAVAQVPEIRLAKQYSMGYLQLNVIEHQKLIEKHAKLLGIPEVKVTWELFNGPAAVNDALLSGNIDIASGGVPGLLVLWAKTKGTPQEVRGVSALSSQPFLLNSRNPDVKTIKDFTASDRIAVPAVKVSVQAIMLQMAAAKAFGEKEFAKLDAQTVSMSPPDATIALLGGKSEVTAAFSVPPFQYQQLEQARHPHRGQLVRRHGRLAFLHGGVDLGEIPRQEPGALQGADRGAERSDRHRQQGQARRQRAVDRGFQIEAAARHGDQDRRRPAGALDA